MMRDKSHAGQAFIGLVLFIGAIVVVIGMLLILLASSSVDSSYGYRAAAQAEAVAQSGIQDALLRLDRDTQFAADCACSIDGYDLAVGSDTATVYLGSASGGLVSITSTAKVSNNVRKINVLASVDASTSQVTVISSQLVQ